MVAPILEAEAMEAAVARLEEGDHRRQIVRAADAVGYIIAAARIGPAGVALLVARGEFDVPVRFDTDALEVTLDLERLGSITSIPLLEIRR